MARTIEAHLRTLADEFAAELTLLAKRVVLEGVAKALEGALDARTPRPTTQRAARRRGAGQAPVASTPSRARFGPMDGRPMSQEAYEREVLSRAITANGGDNLAAARTLGMTKSTFHRRATVLGLRDARATRSN